MGRDQFFEYESFGIRPENPDPYFSCLLDGKKWMHWQCQEYKRLYFGDDGEWWGWEQLRKDFEGNYDKLKHLVVWHFDWPDWLK